MRAFIRIVLGHAARIRAVVVLALAMAGIGGAYLAPAALAAKPQSLAGESFTSRFSGSLSGTCTSDGNGSFTFTTSGTAAGPYPGTFTESGSFTMFEGTVTAFASKFTITSAAGSVSGSKSLAVGNVSTCIPHSGFVDMSSVTPSTTTYTAAINGAYRDTGTASVSLDGVLGCGGCSLGAFNEDFLTSNGVVPLQNDNSQGNNDNQGENN